MAVKISELPAAGSAAGTDQLEANQGGTSRRLTVAQVATHVRSTATDTVVVAAGSASAPSISPTGDSNTGIFFPAADTIAFSEGGVEALRLDSSGNATFAGTAAMASSFLRNRLINGAMAIDQRNAGAAVTPSSAAIAYCVDRFYTAASTTVSGTVTVQRVATNTPGESQFCLRLARTSGSYAGSITVGQTIETANCYDLAGKSITISFRARRGSAYSGSTIGINCYTGTAADQGSAGGVAGTWTGWANAGSANFTPTTSFATYSFTVSIGASVQEIQTNITTGLFSGSGSANDFVEITDVQLEVGSVATPFERRQYGQELALCQRYAYAWGGAGQYVATYSSGLYGDANQITMLPFGINFSGMRSLSATVTTVGTQGTDWAVQTSGGINQTGFTITSTNGMLNAQKTGHGITNSNSNLQVLTSSGRIIVATEL